MEVFKDAERAAMRIQDEVRAEAKGKKRVKKSGPELFEPRVMDNPRHANELKERYCRKARRAVADALNNSTFVLFDHLWLTALSYPMVQEADLKAWVEEWKQQGKLTIQGLAPRQRVPQRGKGIRISRGLAATLD